MEKLWPVSVSLNGKELNAERLAEFALAGVRHIEFTGSEIAVLKVFFATRGRFMRRRRITGIKNQVCSSAVFTV